MKEKLFKGLNVFEEAARKATEKPEWLSEVAGILTSPTKKEIGLLVSFKDEYPELTKLGMAQAVLDQGVFRKNEELARLIEAMCEPYRSAQKWIDDYNREAIERLQIALGSLFQPDKYTQNIATAFQNSLIPTIEACKIDTDMNGVGSALRFFTSSVDTSWLHMESAWAVKTAELLKVETDGLRPAELTKLFSMEQETGRILGENGTLTSIAAQMASITSAYGNLEERWKNLVAPVSLLNDLQDIAFHQHHEIQKAGTASKWRLSLLDGSSRFVDRQVTWTSDFVSGVQDKVIDDDYKEEKDTESTSALSLIPQYIGYTKRENEPTTLEQGLEKSSIVEVTEKGKRIIENIVKINELCARTGRDLLFKYTGKLVIASANLGNIFCSSNEKFGIMIDNFYTMFYENLEHIKSLVSDDSVRKDETYQCIFRVKDMRTDLRHDFEHGGNINKKRRDISECYKHYTGKPMLIHQKDYVTLQIRMYDEFLILEDHLIEKLCTSEEVFTQ